MKNQAEAKTPFTLTDLCRFTYVRVDHVASHQGASNVQAQSGLPNRRFASFSVALALGPTTTHAAQEEKVIISYSSRDFAFLPAHVAATKGFFRDEGFEPVMVQMRPPVAAPALINNEIQYTTTFGSILNAIMQGVPAKLLAVITEKPPYYIVARPGIKSVAELRGKKLAAQPRGLSDRIAAEAIPRIQRRRPQGRSVCHDQRRSAGAHERADQRPCRCGLSAVRRDPSCSNATATGSSPDPMM
jgi:ABC-type nitrate/sulfonate/bicarbonate transport systems, periplasmic components